MSIVETVLVLAVVPLAIYGFIALVTLRSKFAASPKYRPGQEWDYPPVWWSANPEGLARRASTRDLAAGETRGGASGSW